MNARIDGIDLSHWQGGALDFGTAKRAGVRFVFHKATEGTGSKDPNYGHRRDEVAAAGIPFGAYHFARPAASDGKTQARYFLSVARPRPGDMRPMLDLEDAGGLQTGRLTVWVRDFVAEVAKETGVKPIIYTSFTLEDHWDCALWVARYSDAMNPPRVPMPWRQWTIWQFSNGEFGHPSTVPGIGRCDINTINSHDPGRVVEALRIGHTDAPPEPQPKPLERPATPTRVLRARDQLHVALNATNTALALCTASKRPRALLAAVVLRRAVKLLQRSLTTLPPD